MARSRLPNGLRTVIAVAREELADRDPDAVPHRLRKVAASSARRLPPPLEKSLVDAIVGDDGFRAAVIERWESGSIDDEVGRAFLDDPSATLSSLAAVEASDHVVELEEAVEALRHRIVELEAELAEAKRRIIAARDAAATEVSAAKAADRAARRNLEQAAAEATADARRAADEAQRQARRTLALEAEVAELAALVERITARERRRSEAADREDRGSAGSPPSDAAGLAAWLDASERSMRPYRPAASDGREPTDQGPWRLGPGTSPDRAGGLDAVLAMGPRMIVLDGYNVSAALDPSDFASRKGRGRVLTVANTLSRASRGDVVVVFDAAGVDGRGDYRGDLGVSVRFSTDMSADDDIVALLEGATRAVVVSNDRELRDRSEEAGAISIWADALAEWASRQGSNT